MLRKTDTILDDSAPRDPQETAKVDAAVIMTAVVVGFSAGRLAARQPVEFSAEAGDMPGLNQVVGLVNNVVGDIGTVGARQTPDWAYGSVVTGSTGGARLRFGDRDIPLDDKTAQTLRELAASEKEPVGYRGKGAYSGIMNDPVHHGSFLGTTYRQHVPAGPGTRWVPKGHQGAWGLMNPEGPGLPGKPLGNAELVGYAHGMIFAGCRAVAEGPWCTPYEIAVGHQTTKLASCFGCTLFMYANGFPPSDIHLGYAQSWAPVYPSGRTDGVHDVMDDVITMMTMRWSLECLQQLTLGAELLAAARVKEPYASRVAKIPEFLEAHANDPMAGGNLVLDALTVHDKEAERVKQVLG